MKEFKIIAGAFVAAVAILAPGLVPVTSAAAHTPSHLDSGLKVHPLLQVGAQQEPDKKIRVIVQKQDASDNAHDIAHGVGTDVVEEFGFIKAFVLELPQKAALKLGHDPHVRNVSPDGAVIKHSTTSLSPTISTTSLLTTFPGDINAPTVWNNTSTTVRATGRGVAVAVLDTGVNDQHPDFLLSTLKSVNVNRSASRLGTEDGNGHGTHVAGIINGQSSAGTYIGVAPGATVYNVKIATDTGEAHEADLLRGLQWVYDNRATTKIRAVNLSITSATAESYMTSVVDAAVEQLWFNGIAVVVAAGNRGASIDTSWYPPANDPYAITVGCYDDGVLSGTQGLCAFSGRGNTMDGFYKPDVVAPGRKIYSALASSSDVLATQMPGRISADGLHMRLSGTSMAAPMVVGEIALLLQKAPSLTPDQIKSAVVGSTRSYHNEPDVPGLLDANRAMNIATGAAIVKPLNQGLTPNMGINTSNGTVMWGSSYWDSSYWDSSYWDSSYWDVTTKYD